MSKCRGCTGNARQRSRRSTGYRPASSTRRVWDGRGGFGTLSQRPGLIWPRHGDGGDKSDEDRGACIIWIGRTTCRSQRASVIEARREGDSACRLRFLARTRGAGRTTCVAYSTPTLRAITVVSCHWCCARFVRRWPAHTLPDARHRTLSSLSLITNIFFSSSFVPWAVVHRFHSRIRIQLYHTHRSYPTARACTAHFNTTRHQHITLAPWPTSPS